MLNLIDTPGHVDFTYEVSRALQACEGALLDCRCEQGVEAQTMANATLAREAGLKIIPVINKIDLPAADPERVHEEIFEILNLDDDPLKISAKTGMNVPASFGRDHRERSGAARERRTRRVAALLFDSVFDTFRGVIVHVRMMEGTIKLGERVRFMSTGEEFPVEEVGHLIMKLQPVEAIERGRSGIFDSGNPRSVASPHRRHGDLRRAPDRRNCCRAITKSSRLFFAECFRSTPATTSLSKSRSKNLHLTDSSFQFEPETSTALGFGFRCGFLGLAAHGHHPAAARARIQFEFDHHGAERRVSRPRHQGRRDRSSQSRRFSAGGTGHEIEEPYVRATILTPADYTGPIMQLCQDRRGVMLDMKYVTPTRVRLQYELPLAEIVVNFFDQMKSMSRGYASFDYEPIGYKPGDLVKLEILVDGEPLDALSYVVHKDNAYAWGGRVTEKMRDLIPRQMFEIPLQARIEGRIIARETVAAIRKDVLAKCYGGDISRKRKFLEKQKEGKKRMKQFGTVEIPQEAFLAVLKLSEENN